MSDEPAFVTAPTSDQRDEFIRAHYLLIADHATQLSRSRWNYVQLSLFGIAVFYSWLFSAESKLSNSEALDWLLPLPVALAYFGFFQAQAIRVSIHERNDVLMVIEKRYRFKGWAHEVKRRWDTRFRNPFDNLVKVYWLALLTFTYIFACGVRFGLITIPQ